MDTQTRQSEFIDNFRAYGFQPHGILFFTPDIALDIIGEAEKAGIPVLGVDAFTIHLNSTQPHLEHSADFSTLDAGWNEARELITSKKELGLVFDITWAK